MSIKANKKGVRILLKLLLNFVISLALYNTIIFLGEKVHVAIYYVGSTLYVLAIAVLFCVYYVKNGFSVTSVSSDSTSDSNDSGSESMRHEDAKKLLYWIAPMTVTVMIDYLMLFIPNFFR